MRDFSIVVALSPSRGIGKAGTLPWRLPLEMNRFKQLTTNTSDPSRVNAVIMGRNTFFSIPEKYRPLAGRLNVVLTSQDPTRFPSNVIVRPSFDEALKELETNEEWKDKIENVYVIGGARVYEEALDHPGCKLVYCTEIQSPDFECDVFFPKIDPTKFSITTENEQYNGSVQTEKDVQYKFVLYKRVGSE
jgi:dihydrofolate reductase